MFLILECLVFPLRHRSHNLHEIPKKDTDKENYLKAIESFIEKDIKTRAGGTDEILRKDVDINVKAIGWCD